MINRRSLIINFKLLLRQSIHPRNQNPQLPRKQSETPEHQFMRVNNIFTHFKFFKIHNFCAFTHSDHDDKYGVPTLEELGFETDGLKPPVWIGGETEALSE
jgi:hypothetical protein